MNNFPAMTEERRQELIADCEADISCARTLMNAAINVNDGETKAKWESQLLRQQVALAALTAKPNIEIYRTRLGQNVISRKPEMDVDSYVVGYTAPPAPVLKPIELPEALLPANHKSGEAFMAADSQGNYINREFTIKAIRAAGYEVKQ